MSIQPPSSELPQSSLAPIVVIPIRSFFDAKSRLAGALDGPARRRLARAMADQVVAAAGTLGVVIVTDDAEVSLWAQTLGLRVLRHPPKGLNAVVSSAVEHLSAESSNPLIVAHGDLPHARSFDSVVAALTDADIVLVPDRHCDGTNVLGLNPPTAFEFAYGPGSFGKHLLEAERCGLTVEVIDDPALAWDVDTEDDLPDNWPEMTLK